MPDADIAPTEREKWQAEEARKAEELSLRRREVELREKDSLLARLSNPLFLAVLGAILAALTNILVTAQSSKQQREMEKLRSEATLTIEKSKAESQLILEMIKTASPDKAAENLKFLVGTGLIANKETRDAITSYVKNRPVGGGVSLPVPVGTIAGGGRLYTCTIEATDIKKIASALDQLIRPEIPRPWAFGQDDKTASKRLQFTGGPHGYDATITLALAGTKTQLEMRGDTTAIQQLASDSEIARHLRSILNASADCTSS